MTVSGASRQEASLPWPARTDAQEPAMSPAQALRMSAEETGDRNPAATTAVMRMRFMGCAPRFGVRG